MSISIDQQTARFVRVLSKLSLFAGMMFFVYSAYAGTMLDGGSGQVFTGFACLLLLLANCIIIERILRNNAVEVDE